MPATLALDERCLSLLIFFLLLRSGIESNPGPLERASIFCQLCGLSFLTNRLLLAHLKLYHVHEPNFKLRCEVCSKTFTVLHKYSTHQHKVHSKVCLRSGLDFPFHCPQCDYICHKMQKLLVHYRKHIDVGKGVKCPYVNCSKMYMCYSSFTSHVSRIHGNVSTNYDSQPKIFKNSNSVQYSHESFADNSVSASYQTQQLTETDRYFGLLFLKLQTNYNIPSSVIQSIVTDIKDLLILHETHLLDNLHNAFSEGKLLNKISNFDFQQLYCDQFLNALKLFITEYKRYKYYEKNFCLILPEKIILGLNTLNKSCNFQYVPLTSSLTQLLKHEDILKQVMNPVNSANSIIEDFTDGYYCKSSFPNSQRKMLHILYFYDEFQVTNPIGSRRRKHKIAAFYYILGNLYKINRSSLKIIQLSIVCRAVDFKEFKLHTILKPLIKELEELFVTGITIPGVATFDCRLCFCSADNLGSHQLGGFLESFSPNVQRVCRHCLITSDQIQENVHVTDFKLRNPENYNRHALDVIKDSSFSKAYGIKFASPLNAIPGFHVTQGLPPDAMHDLSEGVVPYELSILLRKFIEDDLITLDYLNRRISSFKFKSSDARNKPGAQTLEKDSLIGSSSQNLVFLKLLPLFIGSKIPNENPFWLFYLQLKSIVEMILSPRFSIFHVDLLHSAIDNHLREFKRLFPQYKLKPKHHFLAHYPQHILNFGPLIDYWCMRYEAKHKMLKEIAISANQYINIPYTIAVRHQLAQCHYNQSSKGFLPLEFDADSQLLNANLLEANVKKVIKDSLGPNTNICYASKVMIRSTEYKVGSVLVTGFLQGDPVFSTVEMIFLKEKEVFFLLKKCDFEYLEHYSMYSITPNNCYECLSHDSLTYWIPLCSYNIDNDSRYPLPLTVVSLHHMIFDIGDFMETD